MISREYLFWSLVVTPFSKTDESVKPAFFMVSVHRGQRTKHVLSA